MSDIWHVASSCRQSTEQQAIRSPGSSLLDTARGMSLLLVRSHDDDCSDLLSVQAKPSYHFQWSPAAKFQSLVSLADRTFKSGDLNHNE